jgi:hypothetical protein
MYRKMIPAALIATVLCGCAFPKTVRVYDEECQVMARQMVLDVQQVNDSWRCSNNDCITQLVAEAALLATSTVISGTIVVAGNMIYWLEKKRSCKSKATVFEPSSVFS